MDNLIRILDSFYPGWRERKYVDRFIAILKNRIIPTYPYLGSRIENNKAIFTEEWDQIISALKEAHFFNLFVPAEYGGQKSSDQEIYFMMELLGYASQDWASSLFPMGELSMLSSVEPDNKRKSIFPGWLKGILGQLR